MHIICIDSNFIMGKNIICRYFTTICKNFTKLAGLLTSK
jgi:hypothetical protein